MILQNIDYNIQRIMV